MADGEDEVGAVHHVEVQFLHAVVDEVDHLLGADGRGDEAASLHEAESSLVMRIQRLGAEPESRRVDGNWVFFRDACPPMSTQI